MAELFNTTEEELLRVPGIVSEMKKAGIEDALVEDLYNKAKTCQGTFDLMELWLNAPDKNERNACIKDLEDIITDHKKYTK